MSVPGPHSVSMVETNPPEFDDWQGLHRLLVDSFSFMEGRIDPPSSLLRLTPQGLAEKSHSEDLFLIRDGARPVACAFGLPKPGRYYIGKLAVAAPQRGQGAARAILTAAAEVARAQRLPRLEMETRVDLRENHRAFRRLGFTLVGASTHDGYTQVTSLTFCRNI